jgi:hypothetical protein
MKGARIERLFVFTQLVTFGRGTTHHLRLTKSRYFLDSSGESLRQKERKTRYTQQHLRSKGNQPGRPSLRASTRNLFCSTLLILSLCSPSSALHTRARYKPRARGGKVTRRVVKWTPVLLKGSHDSLLRQNSEIDRLQLARIADDGELDTLVQKQELVALPSDKTVRIDSRLDDNRRYCRPWTRDFLNDLGEAYYKEFRTAIQVNSAVRTVAQQEKLMRHNGNAAPAEGPTASSHLAGLTVDIAKHEMSRKQRKWMEQYLLHMRDLGLVEAVEERKQACFHVMVSDRYTAWREMEKLASR